MDRKDVSKNYYISQTHLIYHFYQRRKYGQVSSSMAIGGHRRSPIIMIFTRMEFVIIFNINYLETDSSYPFDNKIVAFDKS